MTNIPWIDEKDVEAAQESGDLKLLQESGALFCMSKDLVYCVYIRPHSAWQVDDGLWRSANLPPDSEQESRLMLNFNKRLVEDDDCGFWLKAFIPLAENPIGLTDIDGKKLQLTCDSGSKFLSYERIDFLSVSSGHAKSEEWITEKYDGIWDSP